MRKAEILLRSAVKTTTFAQELKELAETDPEGWAELTGGYLQSVEAIMQELGLRLEAIPKPAIRPPKPELLPKTDPQDARDKRIQERRDWSKDERLAEPAEREYVLAVKALMKEYHPSKHMQLCIDAACYSWLLDVQTKPINQICDTAFFGIVGYWLRAREAVEKRGYYFNSDREKWVVVREVEDWLVACADRQLRMHSMVGGNAGHGRW